MKQKNNNVWILTVTFPDPKGSATSKYHTYCLAVGKSSNDHQPVIDHFLKEIETLASGVDVFCPKEGRFIRLQMALLAYIADRPERHSILNQSQGGTFGKRTLWSGVIDYKKLPYCDACFGIALQCASLRMYLRAVFPFCLCFFLLGGLLLRMLLRI